VLCRELANRYLTREKKLGQVFRFPGVGFVAFGLLYIYISQIHEFFLLHESLLL
jgi:hypothetical protein